MTRLPRHSLLRVSYHMLRPFLKPASPTFLYWISQPAEPGLAGGVQYRPSDSNVAMALVLVEGSVRPAPPPVDGGGVVVPGSLVTGGVVAGGVVAGGGVLPATGVNASLSTRASAPPAPLPISLITSLFVMPTLLMVNVAAASTRG